MSDPSHSNKSSWSRKFAQRAVFSDPTVARDRSYDDLPIGSEVCDKSKKHKENSKITPKQGRAANKKGAAYRKALTMQHKLAKDTKKGSALTAPAKRHGETMNSYRARVAKWSKKNA